MRRWLRHLTIADRVFVAVICIMAAPLVMAQFAPEPLTYSNIPFPVVNSPVRSGEAVVVEVGRCNQSNQDLLPYTISRVLVHADTKERTQLPDSSVFMDRKGCETIRSRVTTIPRDTEAGRYYLDAVAITRVHGRSYTARWSTQVFEIIR